MKKTAMLLAAALALAAGGARAETVTVFVGGAMTGPIRAVAADFTKAGGGEVALVSDTTGGRL